MKYKDLQTEASRLGMEKVVGKTQEELLSYIENHSSDDSNDDSKTDKKKKSPTKKEPKYSLATVFDGAREVRQYDLETHGKKFLELANQFSNDRGYRVEMGYIAGKTECPNCGHRFD